MSWSTAQWKACPEAVPVRSTRKQCHLPSVNIPALREHVSQLTSIIIPAANRALAAMPTQNNVHSRRSFLISARKGQNPSQFPIPSLNLLQQRFHSIFCDAAYQYPRLRLGRPCGWSRDPRYCSVGRPQGCRWKDRIHDY